MELAFATMLLVVGVGALLLQMHYAMIRTRYLSQLQVAMNAVQGEVDVLMGTAFDTLWTGGDFSLPITQLPGGRLAVQIRSADLRTPATPTVLNLHVSACWQAAGRQIGEDQNCNGSMDPGEDTNGNGWLDSPAMASTRLARSS